MSGILFFIVASCEPLIWLFSDCPDQVQHKNVSSATPVTIKWLPTHNAVVSFICSYLEYDNCRWLFHSNDDGSFIIHVITNTFEVLDSLIFIGLGEVISEKSRLFDATRSSLTWFVVDSNHAWIQYQVNKPDCQEGLLELQIEKGLNGMKFQLFAHNCTQTLFCSLTRVLNKSSHT